MPQRLLPTDIEGRTPPSAAHPVRLYTRQMEANTRFPRHTHPWAQVAYSHNSVLRVQAGDTAWVVPPSRAIWIPPGIGTWMMKRKLQKDGGQAMNRIEAIARDRDIVDE